MIFDSFVAVVTRKLLVFSRLTTAAKFVKISTPSVHAFYEFAIFVECISIPLTRALCEKISYVLEYITFFRVCYEGSWRQIESTCKKQNGTRLL